jgi:hypothetical protein
MNEKPPRSYSGATGALQHPVEAIPIPSEHERRTGLLIESEATKTEIARLNAAATLYGPAGRAS